MYKCAAIAVARVFRRGFFLHHGQNPLTSEEVSYSNPDENIA